MISQQPQPATTSAVQINSTLQIIPGGRKTPTKAVVSVNGGKTMRVSID